MSSLDARFGKSISVEVCPDVSPTASAIVALSLLSLRVGV